jgi:hypothetical protein
MPNANEKIVISTSDIRLRTSELTIREEIKKETGALDIRLTPKS